jgi:DNA-binding NarL/FixJ family response regulator
MTLKEGEIETPIDTVNVLIVDDQAPFRAAARTVIMVSPGFDMTGEAESGEDAVAQAESLHPDLVLMDINLPGINGIEATRQITTSRPETVVILMSTYRAEDLPADAIESGAKAYVHKEDFGPAVVRQIWDEHHSNS